MLTIWRRRFERSGLLLALVLGGLAYLACDWLTAPRKCGGYVAIAVGLGFAFVWLAKRYLPLRNCYCVALCLRSDESDANLSKILTQVAARLQAVQATKPIRLKVLPADAVTDDESAARYLRITGIPVVVWGIYQRQTKKRHPVDTLLMCTFNARFPIRTVSTQTLERYVRQLGQFLQVKWQRAIRCTDTYLDVPAASANYVQAIVGLLAPICVEAGDALSAADLAEGLLQEVTGLPDAAELAEYLRRLVLYSLAVHRDSQQPLAATEELALLERIWSFPEGRDPGVAADLARAAWDAGVVAKAAYYTEELGQLDPGHPCYPINCGFLSLVRREYDACAKWYRKAYGALRGRPGEVSVVDLAAFLDKQRSAQPEEYGFVFALGIINCAHLDEGVGLKDLQNFLDVVGAEPAYAKMADVARQVIAASASPSAQPPRGRKSRSRRRKRRPAA